MYQNGIYFSITIFTELFGMKPVSGKYWYQPITGCTLTEDCVYIYIKQYLNIILQIILLYIADFCIHNVKLVVHRVS